MFLPPIPPFSSDYFSLIFFIKTFFDRQKGLTVSRQAFVYELSLSEVSLSSLGSSTLPTSFILSILSR